MKSILKSIPLEMKRQLQVCIGPHDSDEVFKEWENVFAVPDHLKSLLSVAIVYEVVE